MWDYDLVIIGGSIWGRQVALEAVKVKSKRIALIEFQLPIDHSIIRRAIAHLVKAGTDPVLESRLGFPFGRALNHITWEDTIAIGQQVLTNQQELLSLSFLSSLGVDVIKGLAELVPKPVLSVVVNNRRLRSRSFLIAPNDKLVIPKIQGLNEVNFLTHSDLFNSSIKGNNLAIMGSQPIAVELAQSLNYLGYEVILVATDEQILTGFEPEVINLIQNKLEAEGVTVITKSPITQVKKIDGKTWIQVGKSALEVDQLIIVPPAIPDTDKLNLEGVGVKLELGRILVNSNLQTTNPRIYAGGQSDDSYYTAKVLVNNSLFNRRLVFDRYRNPQAVFTNPEIAQVGLSEVMARKKYHDVLVIKQNFNGLAQAQIIGQETGLIKIIINRRGKILGASLISDCATELISVMSLAIAKGLRVQDLASLNSIIPSLSQVFHTVAATQRRKHETSWLRWLRWARI